MKYFITINKSKEGPYDKEELVNIKGFNNKTLVWREGLESWEYAESFHELKSILAIVTRRNLNKKLKEPPPIPSAKELKNREIYDEGEKPLYELSFVAIVIGVLLPLLGWMLVEIYQMGFDTLKIVSMIIPSVLRIISCIVMTNLAKRQNRSDLNWGLFALFLPLLAMFIFGFMKKLKPPTKETRKFSQEELNKIKSRRR